MYASPTVMLATTGWKGEGSVGRIRRGVDTAQASKAGTNRKARVCNVFVLPKGAKDAYTETYLHSPILLWGR